MEDSARVLVIVPSRNRFDRLQYMLGEALRLSGGGADFAVCTDDDDPAPYGDLVSDRVAWFHGRRKSMCAWTNYAAAHPRACRYGYLASFGDDHVPRTRGWDGALPGAIEEAGGTGIAYGDDLHQGGDLPTAPVISRDITDALGWMCLPGLASKYCDDAWKILGGGAGCLLYEPEVVIEHVHPDAGKAPQDAVYVAGNESYPDDGHVFRAWTRAGAAADTDRVRQLMAARRRGVPA
jgi:hypothetical protein